MCNSHSVYVYPYTCQDQPLSLEYLGKAVHHSAGRRGVEEHHGHTQHVGQQARVQDPRGRHGSVSQQKSPQENEDAWQGITPKSEKSEGCFGQTVILDEKVLERNS